MAGSTETIANEFKPMSPHQYAAEVAEKVKAAGEERARLIAGHPVGQLEPLREYPIPVARLLVELITGRPTKATPLKIEFDGQEEGVALVLASKKGHYYRVTALHCTCKGWQYSYERYGVGQCRHHNAAFPKQAAKNAKTIEQVKGTRAQPLPPAEAKKPFKPFLE